LNRVDEPDHADVDSGGLCHRRFSGNVAGPKAFRAASAVTFP
jgi:hypothetical protein